MNELAIHDFLREAGLNEYGIAGLMGNLFAESGLNPKNLQNAYEKSLGFTDDSYTAAVDNGTYTNFVYDKAGYGLWQLTYWSRKEGFLKYVKSKGKSIGDLHTQLEYLVIELRQYGLLDALKNASSVQEASDLILLNFEKPKSINEPDTRAKAMETRASYGQRYYDQFVTASVKGGSSMKYNENNKPMVCMQTQSTCYKGTRTMTVKGVLWHSTGANNPWLKRYIQPSDNAADKAQMLEILGKNQYGNDWNHIERSAGLNCWIGKLADGTVTTIQTMPWDYKPWGCGAHPTTKWSCNDGWIQFEICEDGLDDVNYFNKVYKEACEITAYLCKMFNIDPYGTVLFHGVQVPTITCHNDAANLRVAYNHSDINHWFPKYGKNMATARDDVAALMNTQTTATNTEMEDDDMDVKRFKELHTEMRKELQNNNAGEWSAEARAWAISTGLVVGGDKLPDGTPNYMWGDDMTREQLVTVLYRFARFMGKA